MTKMTDIVKSPSIKPIRSTNVPIIIKSAAPIFRKFNLKYVVLANPDIKHLKLYTIRK